MEILKYFETEKFLNFFLIDCGSGLMHLIIFPDNLVMLFDCNVTEENKDEILAFLNEHIPSRDGKKEIDIFVNSHRDIDHLRGLKHINSLFKIKSIWDSGQSGCSTENEDYKYYMQLRRSLKAEDLNNLFVPNPTNIPIASFEGADIYCLAAEADFEENCVNEAKMSAKIQHTNSMVLLVIYADRKMLLTGDSDWKSWKEGIVPNFSKYAYNYENTDILIASHHGSRSFFTDETVNDTIDIDANPETTYIESIELVNPILTLISCGDYKTYHHPNDAALKLYKKWSCEEQVFTTNRWGTFCGIINSDGNFAALPYVFKTSRNIQGKGFDIKCKNVIDNSEVCSGDEIDIGCSLRFSIVSWGNIINTTDNITVTWQVANTGVGEDIEHHEIYSKGRNEDDNKYGFSRELCFKGIHLLRCNVANKSKGFSQTKIFVVRGR